MIYFDFWTTKKNYFQFKIGIEMKKNGWLFSDCFVFIFFYYFYLNSIERHNRMENNEIKCEIK